MALKVFNCVTCGSAFERCRPDANRQIFCSLACRMSHYAEPRDSGCVEWTGAVSKETGYGMTKVEGKTTTAHRLSFFLATGAWPKLHVLHACDNRICVNPDHLREGTPKDNVDDVIKRRRHAWFRWSDKERKEWIAAMLRGRGL